MHEPHRKRPSMFANAERSACICAEIGLDDVLAVRPDWTAAQAKAFIDANINTIALAMLLGGLQVIEQLAGRGPSDA